VKTSNNQDLCSYLDSFIPKEQNWYRNRIRIDSLERNAERQLKQSIQNGILNGELFQLNDVDFIEDSAIVWFSSSRCGGELRCQVFTTEDSADKLLKDAKYQFKSRWLEYDSLKVDITNQYNYYIDVGLIKPTSMKMVEAENQ
jgi:hypothetical protein